MSSFFEKLRRGMGIEGPAEGEVRQGRPTEERVVKEPIEKKEEVKKVKKTEIKAESKTPLAPPVEREVKRVEVVKEPEIKREIKKPSPGEKPSFVEATKDKEKWLEKVPGQLAVDVYQTESELVIQSAIAGIGPEDLNISIERDVITIRGERKKPSEENGDYFTQECYWGQFSREIILPVEIDPNRVEAILKEGILTIRMPKILREKRRKIIVKK